MQDEAARIFLNTKGTMEDVSGHVRRFLRFLDSASAPDPSDELLVKMNQELQKVRNNEEWRRDYMTLLMELKEREARGRKEGKKEGMKEAMRRMLQNGISPEQVADIMGVSLREVQEIEREEAHSS